MFPVPPFPSTGPRRRGRAALLASLGLVAAIALATGARAATFTPQADAPTDRLIVKYREGAGPTQMRAMSAMQVAGNRHGVRLQALRQMAGGAHVMAIGRSMPMAEALALATSLRNGDAGIEYVEPDRLMHPQLVPDDPLLAQQWALSDPVAGLRAPTAWDVTRGAGVTVAFIDTGVRPHPDLAANLLPGYDFIVDTKVAGDGNGRDADASDPGDGVTAGQCGSGSAASNSSWHGTHVAGLIAAVAGNASGVSGVAPQAKLLPLRALGKCGGYTSDIADAIVWAAGGSVSGLPANPNPAKVINLSLGSSGNCSTTTQTAINTARGLGAVVVASAGNSNVDVSTQSPANCSGVVAVAAVGKTGGKASYSNTGTGVAIAAPGGDGSYGLLSTWNRGTLAPGADGYALMMGTSMAAPQVSGVVALMRSVNRALTPDQVLSLLKSSARPFPAACVKCGAGLLDATAAVQAALAAATVAPPVVTTPVPVTPTLTAVAEVESNDSLASAQALPAAPLRVTGAIASATDSDHYRTTLAAGARITVTLAPSSSSSGFGLTLFSASGQTLLSVPGALGVSPRLQVSNGGTSAAVLVLRVQRSVGITGGYTLTLN